MSFDRTARSGSRSSVQPPKPASRAGFIIGIIILAIIVIVLIIILIILLVRRRGLISPQCTANTDCPAGQFCSNNRCVSCSAPPSTPSTVTITYDSDAGTATLNWAPSNTASSYNVYRKLGDPSVGVNNYTRREGTTATTKSFTSLENGTHYFVVTALNACGESAPSSPVRLAAVCSSRPAAMAAPIVTQTDDNCISDNIEIVEVEFDNENIDNGVYVIQGTGQHGTVGAYTYLVPGEFHGPASDINLSCGGVSTNHNVMQITDVTEADITVTSDGPIVTGTSFKVTWNQVPGAERYIIFVVGVNGDSVPHYYGGFAEAHETALTIQTNEGDTLVFGIVLGFRICDASDVSASTEHITPLYI